MRRLAALFCVCLVSFSCGYRLRGTGSSLPPHIKRIQVPMFENQTTRYELDRKLTQGLIDELVARGKVEIVASSDAADAVLSGEIRTFNATPIGFSSQGSADRYNITIVVKIVLRDQANKKVIFQQPSYMYQGEYEVPEGTDFESVETEALNEIARKFARSVVINILEGF
jgi:outer membrane lipopolysaccharide assembly protein LptE/RlpB